MKRVWFGAAAVAALSLSAFGASTSAQAHEQHACIDDACEMVSLLPDFAQIAAQTAGGGVATSLESPRYGAWGFDITGMDTTVKPGDDFYKFANGVWEARTEIPSDRARYGNFDKLAELSDARTKAIIEAAAADKAAAGEKAKVGAAYRAFMDEAGIEKLDAAPLKPWLDEVRKVKTKDEFTTMMGRSSTTPYASILGVGVSIDAKNPKAYAVMAGTSGLSLPDRDYYLDAKFADKKTAYLAYVQQMLTLGGWDKPAEHAKAIVDFETKLAEASWTRVERRDRDKTYNPANLAELQAMTPGYDWKRYLAAAELSGVDRIIVTTNTAFPKFAKIYADTPVDTLKAWQAFKVIDGAAPLLSKRFVDAAFAFRNKTLAGQPEQRPRWKRGVAQVNNMLGEAVGKDYVAAYFPASSKAKMESLVGDIRTVLKTRIDNLDWMGAETKVKAQDKLAKFTVKIGYPDHWRDYSALEIKDNDAYGNLIRAGAWDYRYDVARLNKPVDKTEWGMTPQTVNAYYNFANNEIVFPAAILQAPFFHPDADPAINYGGIGGVIGHEIGHGFDDQGRKSDGDGVLRDWWTAEDGAKFQVQADKLGAQYSAFEPFPGVHVNGKLTMGENIGDMAGLAFALDAYRVSLHGKPAPVLDGFTGDQRVYLGWAQVWRGKSREDALKQQIASDPHSPGYYRVNGTIRNQPGWYSAFDVKAGDTLYVAPADRVKIW
ncbi:M13 family metallopeptidase [Caulobacter sp. RHG1]|uniref:M13 family metallopeptidase n=1 Tax=Caulobacter sp. (strain RHG1) TaxID=2545762 RepID=UPI0015566D86|nr:M13-type metalloendopeptidase [Caulobacter sp. RHG1]NQE61965.1 Metallopeptidase [Caulobacter sp. RHG1]